MAGINKAILIGNLGQDPELRYTQSGKAVVNFSLATSESWNKRDGGGREERTEWHRIVAWDRTAELCAQYLAKGRTVYIEGRIQTREWENKQGEKQRTTEIVATTVQFLGGRGGQGDSGRTGGGEGTPTGGGAPSGDGGGPSGAPSGGGGGPSGAPSDGGGGPSGPPPEDDIPF